MSGIVTPKRQAALDYVREHPGCTGQEVARATGLDAHNIGGLLNGLYAKKLLGRQLPLRGTGPTFWYPETVVAADIEYRVPPLRPLQRDWKLYQRERRARLSQQAIAAPTRVEPPIPCNLGTCEEHATETGRCVRHEAVWLRLHGVKS